MSTTKQNQHRPKQADYGNLVFYLPSKAQGRTRPGAALIAIFAVPPEKANRTVPMLSWLSCGAKHRRAQTTANYLLANTRRTRTRTISEGKLVSTHISTMPTEQHVLYHGTSRENAQLIREQGFKPSQGGCLGPGTYVAHADKASRFAANCPRHGGDAGAVVKVRITFTKPKYVKYNDSSWHSQGYDACRADTTSRSGLPEWCLKDSRQVEVLEIRNIACGEDMPAFEDEALSLSAVRRLAERAGWAEVSFSAPMSVVSFCAAADSGSPQVDVYFLTGTVIVRPHGDGRGASVKRKVATAQLQTIVHELETCQCSHHARKRPALGSPRMNQRVVEQEEDAVNAVLVSLRLQVDEAERVLSDHRARREEEARRAAEERKREQERLAREEAERQRAAEAVRQATAAAAAETARQEADRQRQAAAAELSRSRKFRGDNCVIAMSNDHARGELEKRKTTLLTVTHLTLVGEGFFLARENGDSFWTQLPLDLADRLREDGLWTKGAVKYIAAGPNGQYYADVGGQILWSGNCSDSFDDAARASRSISRVAFGEDTSWIVLYADGGSAWHGIPTALHNKLQGRGRKLPPPVEVALGKNSTWYVKFKDGKYDYSLPTIVAASFQDWSDAGWTVRNVVLNAENGDWLLRYTYY